eukprot:UN06877
MFTYADKNRDGYLDFFEFLRQFGRNNNNNTNGHINGFTNGKTAVSPVPASQFTPRSVFE